MEERWRIGTKLLDQEPNPVHSPASGPHLIGSSKSVIATQICKCFMHSRNDFSAG